MGKEPTREELMEELHQLRRMNIFGCGLDIETIQSHTRELAKIEPMRQMVEKLYNAFFVGNGKPPLTEARLILDDHIARHKAIERAQIRRTGYIITIALALFSGFVALYINYSNHQLSQTITKEVKK